MRTLLLSLFFLFRAFNSISQSTTETEYNYMKKGYRQVEESGLDVKQGYTTELLGTKKSGYITATFTRLKRNDGTIAGIIIKTVSDETFGSGTNYYCLPAANRNDVESFGWNEWNRDVASMTSGVQAVVFNWIAYRMTFEMASNNK